MEAYAQVLNFAIPFFMLLIAIEYGISRWKGVEVNRFFDTISSISSGLTNIIKDVLGLTVIIISYSWMLKHLAIFNIESSIALYILAFIGKDFAGYWSHRFEHVVNVFWNRHIVHHSSEEFNLSCALRQSVSSVFAIFFFLYIPLAIVGVPTEVIAVVAPLHLFAQFWYHTRLIKRMGFLEHILVTPSHHRVHHAINDEYLDKNFAQIFIVWDKWFGTFQEEDDNNPPVYGVKKPVRTWNPILINYQHLWGLIKDAWRTQKLWDKCRIWFMPTGWRPADVRAKFPIEVDDAYTQRKYETSGSLFFKIWTFTQLILTAILMLYLFNRIADFAFEEVLAYGLFLTVSVFAYTSLMDGNRLSILAEIAKVSIASFLIFRLGNWFELDQFISYGTLIVIAYLVLSFLATLYFNFIDRAKVITIG